VAARLAAALPDGVDLAVKEHPLSIGRNSLSWLRRLASIPGVRHHAPRTSTHDLIAGAEGVAVIGSTVGLEALLHGKPVLTLGEPFYAGYDITVDIDGLEDVDAGVAALLRFQPDGERILEFLHAAMGACLPGAPVLVDNSDLNARTLAASLEEAVREFTATEAEA
jgi:capsule polysaccharide export protein KpsC/LpsZ